MPDAIPAVPRPKRTRKAHPPIEIGQKFGDWTVLGLGPPYVRPSDGAQVRQWRLRCACGSESIRNEAKLRSGQSRDCGCARAFKAPPIGARYGRLVVTGAAFLDDQIWIVPAQCDCGRAKDIRAHEMMRGTTKACGSCRTHTTDARAKMAAAKRRHGLRGTPEYHAWTAMRARCLNPRHEAYERYGGRGITICERWLASFENFYADMGPKPSPSLSIERTDNDKGYGPENCIWADAETQNRNRTFGRRGSP